MPSVVKNQYANIRAVTFDAAHTLFHPHPSVGAIYREVMLEHGLDYPESDLEAGFRRAFKTQVKDATILDGEARERSYWQAVVKESIRELKPQPKNFAALFDDLWDTFSHANRWRPAHGAVETLQTLRDRGYQVALLTNWDARVRTLLKENGYDRYFDHLFISSEIGYEKPAPEIFQHAAQALKLPPEQILHIGDSLQHDIEGAQAAGWTAVRILDKPLESQPHRPNIHALPELLDILLLPK